MDNNNNNNNTQEKTDSSEDNDKQKRKKKKRGGLSRRGRRSLQRKQEREKQAAKAKKNKEETEKYGAPLPWFLDITKHEYNKERGCWQKRKVKLSDEELKKRYAGRPVRLNNRKFKQRGLNGVIYDARWKSIDYDGTEINKKVVFIIKFDGEPEIDSTEWTADDFHFTEEDTEERTPVSFNEPPTETWKEKNDILHKNIYTILTEKNDIEEKLKKAEEIIETGKKTRVEDRDIDPCSICKEKIDPTDKIAIQCIMCKAKFHNKCIDRWKKNGSGECPLCRGERFIEIEPKLKYCFFMNRLNLKF